MHIFVFETPLFFTRAHRLVLHLRNMQSRLGHVIGMKTLEHFYDSEASYIFWPKNLCTFNWGFHLFAPSSPPPPPPTHTQTARARACVRITYFTVILLLFGSLQYINYAVLVYNTTVYIFVWLKLIFNCQFLFSVRIVFFRLGMTC